MPSWGFLLLLFPARNFTPIASATQLLNREHIMNMYQGMAQEQPPWYVRARETTTSLVDAIIPVQCQKNKITNAARDDYVLNKIVNTY